MAYAENILIDGILPRRLSGWLHKSLADSQFALLVNGQLFPLAPLLDARDDLPDNYLGFALELPQPVVADSLLSVETALLLNGRLPVRLHKLAILRFALQSLSTQELAQLNAMLDLNVLFPQDKPQAFNETIVGEGGWLFLEQGSNSLTRQYSMPEEQGLAMAKKIARLIARRQDYCASLGIGFLQILVPEKTSALIAKSGQQFQTPTPLYRNLAAILATDNKFLDLYPHLASEKYWRRGDSHLTSDGALAAILLILKRLGLKIEIQPINRNFEFAEGGLINYLAGSQGYYEQVEYFDNIVCNGASSEPELVKSIGARQQYVGIQLTFHNPGAAIAKKLLVFGNSFCGKTQLSTNFSWYFARLFRDFTFVWEAEIDSQIVEREMPDLIICQTIERFLPSLANAQTKRQN